MFYYDERKNQWIRLCETREYKQRCELVKSAWIFVGLLMVFSPIYVQLIIAMLSTFLSFSFLDEADYGFVVSSPYQ